MSATTNWITLDEMKLSVRGFSVADGDVIVLQDILDRAPEYFLLERGEVAGPHEAREMLDLHPPGRTREDKEVLLAFDDETAVGCVDVAFGWPDPSTATIGLLLIVEDRQRRGIGRGIYALLEDMLRSRFHKIRIGVLSRNDRALAFWVSLGFIATGDRKRHACGTVIDEILVFEKVLG